DWLSIFFGSTTALSAMKTSAGRNGYTLFGANAQSILHGYVSGKLVRDPEILHAFLHSGLGTCRTCRTRDSACERRDHSPSRVWAAESTEAGFPSPRRTRPTAAENEAPHPSVQATLPRLSPDLRVRS